jgi:hypothetical protein
VEPSEQFIEGFINSILDFIHDSFSAFNIEVFNRFHETVNERHIEKLIKFRLALTDFGENANVLCNHRARQKMCVVMEP